MSIVDIPGMPGERIDQRILPDVLALIKRYKVKVTDGYALTGHAAGGEHPLGLAVDLVPDTARGGTWDDVDALARAAEPTQNAPRKPFRWVGYTGDSGHGRNDHLHLSWLHPSSSGAAPGAVAGIEAFKVDGGPLGTLESAAGTVAGVAGDAATAAAKALFNVLWSAFGEEGARIALYIALVAGGTVLAVVGLKRTIGVKGPSASQIASVAELTPAGRGAKVAGAAAGAGAGKAAA